MCVTPRYYPACASAIAVVTMVGCAIDSAGVLREIRTIESQRHSGDFLESLTSVGRFAGLADAVKFRSEDVVTEAYMNAATCEERARVIGIADHNIDGSGRYIPLLCFALQFDRDLTTRIRAARALGTLKRINPVISRSAIALVLGNALVEAESSYLVERFAYCLEEFLLNACAFRIPDTERTEAHMPLNAEGTVRKRVVRSDPALVRMWWVDCGRRTALEGGFDQP